MRESRLLLASQSPRRRELLALLGLPFDLATPNVAETPHEDELPAVSAARFSQAKAHAAHTRLGERRDHGTIIVACDTVVAHKGQLLGKPRDAVEATAMLRRLRGQPHAVYSAVTLLGAAGGRMVNDMAQTELLMRLYTDAELHAYVASGDPLDKAGAYGIQNADFCPVDELQGCYANVMGLPLCHLVRCLRAFGVEPTQDVPAACQAHNQHVCTVYTGILAEEPCLPDVREIR
jgi:septum formation protein